MQAGNGKNQVAHRPSSNIYVVILAQKAVSFRDVCRPEKSTTKSLTGLVAVSIRCVQAYRQQTK